MSIIKPQEWVAIDLFIGPGVGAQPGRHEAWCVYRPLDDEGDSPRWRMAYGEIDTNARGDEAGVIGRLESDVASDERGANGIDRLELAQANRGFSYLPSVMGYFYHPATGRVIDLTVAPEVLAEALYGGREVVCTTQPSLANMDSAHIPAWF